jgi:rhodanese-related sulfurtransferase
MDHRIIEFTIKHWVLIVAFVLLLILLIREEMRAKGMGSAGITAQKLSLLMNRENALVVDIRDVNAFKDGYIIGSKNIPAEQMDQQVSTLEKYKDQPLVIVCDNGQKSPAIAGKLEKQGFQKVYVLTGGLVAWKQAGMPVVSK